MKTRSAHITGLLVLLAAACLQGCTRNVPEDIDADVELRFTPVLYQPVRSGSSAFGEGVRFCAYAWAYPAGRSISEGSLYLDGALLEDSGEIRTVVPPVLWPSSRQRLALLAFAPAQSGGFADMTSGVQWRDVDVRYAGEDYLYTQIVQGQGKFENEGVVLLPFRHAFAHIGFSIKHNDPEGTTLAVKSLRVGGLRCRGDFASLPQPRWTLAEETQTLTFFEGTVPIGYTFTLVGESLALPAQVLDGRIMLEMERSSEDGSSQTVTLEGRLPAIPIVSGRSYTLELAINADELSFVVDIIKGGADE